MQGSCQCPSVRGRCHSGGKVSIGDRPSPAGFNPARPSRAMSKRVLSSAPLPVAKRQRNLFLLNSETQHPPIINFDDTLYDELVLSIFSHLSWVDLCVIQTTSKNWSRLAADNELWRNLYLRVYGRSRLRGARGHIGRADGREVKPLPGRATADDYKDWKWMFRISSNWRRGMCDTSCYFYPPRFTG